MPNENDNATRVKGADDVMQMGEYTVGQVHLIIKGLYELGNKYNELQAEAATKYEGSSPKAYDEPIAQITYLVKDLEGSVTRFFEDKIASKVADYRAEIKARNFLTAALCLDELNDTNAEFTEWATNQGNYDPLDD